MDYKPTDEAAELCGFDDPLATVTVLYLDETGQEQTLVLTFGSENLDQTGYYVQLGEDPLIVSPMPAAAGGFFPEVI